MASSFVDPDAGQWGQQPGVSSLHFGPSRYQQLQPTLREEDPSPGAFGVGRDGVLLYMGGSSNGGTPIAGWLIMQNTIKMDPY